MPRSSGDDILPITLTEVIILLFFILALAFAWTTKRLELVDRGFLDSLEKHSPDFVPGSMWDDLTNCVDRPDECDLGAAEALDRLADDLGIGTDRMTAKDIAEEIERQLAEAKDAARKGLIDKNLPTTPVDSAGPIIDWIEAFRGQGDFPPCWAEYSRGTREIIFAFDVLLFSETVRVVPIWPDRYDGPADRVTGLRQLAAEGEMSYGRYHALAAPVLVWSNRQDLACRHYIRIHDHVEGGDEKEIYKTNLEIVEGYFYKLLVG